MALISGVGHLATDQDLLKAEEGRKRLENGVVEITLPLTRQDIADMAGTVMETAIRTLSKFQKQHRFITVSAEPDVDKNVCIKNEQTKTRKIA